jgi:hypothetical protein
MQSQYQIQQALEGFLFGQSFMSGVTKIPENDATFANFAMQPDITGKYAVRTTLVPALTTVETLGLGGFIKPNGFLAVDVAGATGDGYAGTKQLLDQIMGAFTPGLVLSLSNGDEMTIEVASPSVNLNAGASKSMGKLFLVQCLIKYYVYTTP